MDLRISGQDQLRKLAAHIKATGDKGLGRQMAKALDNLVEPIKRDIGASAYNTMPSGYRDTLTRSLKHRRSTRITARQATIRLTTTATGTKEGRDLPALEAGRLRHPVYGRSRNTKRGRIPNPWTVTDIKAGFHKRGTEDAADRAEKALLGVLDDFTERLAKG
jgi:hypothetical protein